MKNILLVACCFIFLGNINGQDDQFSIIVKKSADWCPNCGGWAWPVFEDIVEKMETRNGIPILMHHSGDLANEVSIAITEELGGNGQPEFFLNSEIQNITPSNAGETIDLLVETVDSIAMQDALMGIDVEDVFLSLDGNSLSAEMIVEFNGLVSGDFSFGLYLIQNNISHNQEGQGEVLQPKLLTASFIDEPFGFKFDVDTSTIGRIKYPLTLEAPSTLSVADGDTEIVAIIWQWDENDNKTFFNADVWRGAIEQISNTNEVSLIQESLKGNILGNRASLYFDSTQQIENATFFINDISGRSVYTQSVSKLQEGNNTLEADVSNLTNGIYVMGLNVEGTLTTVKVYKK